MGVGTDAVRVLQACDAGFLDGELVLVREGAGENAESCFVSVDVL